MSRRLVLLSMLAIGVGMAAPTGASAAPVGNPDAVRSAVSEVAAATYYYRYHRPYYRGYGFYGRPHYYGGYYGYRRPYRYYGGPYYQFRPYAHRYYY